tara:strand:+ start:5555 stop:6151 length:597 start_codon:yes stop_codon:yes gene_type:complete
MTVNDTNSRRKLSIIGNGWIIGEISLEYISRYGCSSGLLDEKDFEFEEEKNIKTNHHFLSFSNSIEITLENLDTKEQEKYEFKKLKKLGIYKGKLNPEDLVLTNSFEKIPKIKNINHIDYEDEDYYIEFIDSWKGIFSEYHFEQGEIFECKDLIINVEKFDAGKGFYEWVCKIKYPGKLIESKNMIRKKRIKKLKVRR